MASLFNRAYRSFEDFERAELRMLDHIYEAADPLTDDLLAELDEEPLNDEDGLLFDDFEDSDEED